MNQKFEVWSDGNNKRQGQEIKTFFSKEKEEISLGTNNFQIQDIYFNGDFTLILTVNKRLFRRGLFPFENVMKKEEEESEDGEENKNKEKNDLEKDKFTQVKLPKSDDIINVKMGTNHVLLLGKSNNIYAFGDNYYGQLGINEKLLPYSKDPVLVQYNNNPLSCEYIHAYKDNSFAIDKKNHHLYVWGKKDFIPNGPRTNIYRPLKIMENQQFSKVKTSGGRIILITRKEDHFDENKSYKNIMTHSQLEELKEIEMQNINKSISKEMNIEGTLLKKSLPQNEVNNEEESKNSEDKKKQKNRKEEEINDFEPAKDMRKICKKAIKIGDKDQYIKDLNSLRDVILYKGEYPFLEQDKLKDMFQKVDKILFDSLDQYQSGGVRGNIEKTEDDKIPNRKRLELFGVIFACNIADFYEAKKYKAIESNLENNLKEIEECLNYVKDNDISNRSEQCFIENMKRLLNDTAVFRIIETYTHLFGFCHYLLKAFDFNKIYNNLQSVMENANEQETKEYLLEQIYKNILILKDFFDKSRTKFYKYISENSNTNYELEDEEKYMFKFIYEINSRLINVWSYYTFHAKEKCLLELKRKNIYNLYTVFKDLYSIHLTAVAKSRIRKSVISTIIHDKIDKMNGTDSMKATKMPDIYGKEIKKEIMDYTFLQEKLKNYLKNFVDNSKELIIREVIGNYASAVNNMIETKKMFLAVLTNVQKEKGWK